MKKGKLLSIILVCVLAALVVGSVLYFYVFDDKDDVSVYDVLKDAPIKDYTVTVKTVGDMPLPDVDVFVYFDSSFEKIIDYSKTDKDGAVTFSLAEYQNYAVVLSGVTDGYDVADYYSFNGDNTNITLTSALIADKDIYDAKLSVGNVMYDWTVTTADGNTVAISDILAQNKMLLINFWYTASPSAIEQLKIFNDLYSRYSDSVEIIALNPVDNTDDIIAFNEDNAFDFHMASCSRRLSAVFGVSRCPTTVIIDRFGVITLLEVGNVSSIEQLVPVFDRFTNDTYVQQLYRGGMTEFVSEPLPVPTVFEVVAKDGDDVKLSGVEIKLITEDFTLTAITDDAGVARFDVSTKENDKLYVLNCPEGYEYKGEEEIILSDAMFTYNVIFKSLKDE